MQFDPAIHTKEFLLGNPSVAIELAQESAEFAKSSLAQDYFILQLIDQSRATVAHWLALKHPDWALTDGASNRTILEIRNDFGCPVAHALALNQSSWVFSSAAKDFDILNLRDSNGNSVAHMLAQNQSEWLFSDAARSTEILSLTSSFGLTVAHRLAQHQPEWMNSLAAKDKNILLLSTESGYSVASSLIFNQDCERNYLYDNLLHKELLTIVDSGILLAQKISDKYGESYGIDKASMANILISQGAAYQDSGTITSEIGQSILNNASVLIKDTFEPELALRYAQALYSTIFHNVQKSKASSETDYFAEWQCMLETSEQIIKTILSDNPHLYDSRHFVDKFCEPADEFLNKVKSERILSSLKMDEISSMPGDDEFVVKHGLY